ncbi:MAG: DUF799 family lipoprotein [Elusimicrobia bacterium]|nr:DUF799 family lipoprotein [Elusimicrobiota bacterium]
MRSARWLLPAALAAAGCAKGVVRYVAPDYAAKAPPRVAVLPFGNQSVDLLGPEVLRGLVQSALTERGFQPLALDAVDAKLAELGIHEGGQLAGTAPEKLAEALGADGLFYGTVEEFTMQNVGFLIRRVVKLRLRLVSAADGERLWEDMGEGFSASVTLDKKEAQRLFLLGIFARGMENALHTPLIPESRLAVEELISRLPRR